MLSVVTLHRKWTGKCNLASKKDNSVRGFISGSFSAPVSIKQESVERLLKGTQKMCCVLNTMYKRTKSCAVTKAVQRHCVCEKVIHIEFLAVNQTDRINIKVPVKTVKEPKRHVGLLWTLVKNEIEVNCLCNRMPRSLVLDVFAYEVEKHIYYVRDLFLPEHVVLSMQEQLKDSLLLNMLMLSIKAKTATSTG